MILLFDICKDVSNVAYLGWRGLGKPGAWSPPQGAKSHVYMLGKGHQVSFPRSDKVSFGCLSLTGDMRDLVQNYLFLIYEWLSSCPSSVWLMRACVTWQSSFFICRSDGWLLSMSIAAIDMDAIKTSSTLQWATSTGDNLYETEKVFFPTCSARAMQTVHPFKMLVWFPLVSFLCFYW